MGESVVIHSSDYLYGTTPTAVLVVHSETAKDYSDYTLDGPGTLFTLNYDLYITNTELTSVVAPENVTVVFNGETLPCYQNMPASGTVLLAGYTGARLTNPPTLIGVTGNLLAGYESAGNGGAMAVTAPTTISGVTFSGNSAKNGGAIYSESALLVNQCVFDGSDADPSVQQHILHQSSG